VLTRIGETRVFDLSPGRLLPPSRSASANVAAARVSRLRAEAEFVPSRNRAGPADAPACPLDSRL